MPHHMVGATLANVKGVLESTAQDSEKSKQKNLPKRDTFFESIRKHLEM